MLSALSSSAPWLLGLRRHGALGISALSARFHAGALAASGSAPDTEAEEAEEVEDPAAIERYRAGKNFKRRLDGRVLLRAPHTTDWMEVKLDGYVEGSLLLRGREGLMYYLVSEDLKQIDLSNDQLVGQLFGEGGWEKLMQPLCTQMADGQPKHVKMTPQQFRTIFTVLRESPAAQPSK